MTEMIRMNAAIVDQMNMDIVEVHDPEILEEQMVCNMYAMSSKRLFKAGGVNKVRARLADLEARANHLTSVFNAIEYPSVADVDSLNAGFMKVNEEINRLADELGISFK